MKKLLTFLITLFLSVYIYAQSSPTLDIRIANATTTFGQNLPIGTKVYNVDTGLYYVAISGVESTSTLTSASASFAPIITRVYGTAPIRSSGGGRPNITIQPATIDSAGSLSAVDKVRINNMRLIQNHDSLSTLDEKSYNSLTDKPVLTVYRLLNNHDSLSVLDEKSYNSLTDQPNLNVYRLLNNHDSLSTLDEKAHASLTNVLGRGSYHVSQSERDSIISAKQSVDSTSVSGYTRRDRLTTELFKKVDKVSGKALPDKNFTAADSILLVQYNLAKDSLRTKVNRNAAITGATKTKITYDSKGLITSGADATTADIAASTDKNYITDVQKDSTNNKGFQSKYAISLKKDKSDSTNSDGYTRRDRLSTELFKKVDKVINYGLVRTTAKDSITTAEQHADTIRNSGHATVYDVSLKQNTLTNPITGTGAFGQVSFFNGTSTITGDNDLFWDNTNKRLGIGGVITPSSVLNVVGRPRFENSTSGNAQTLQLINTNTATTGNNTIGAIWDLSDLGGSQRGGEILVGQSNIWDGVNANRNSYMAFYTINANSFGEKVRIRADGNIGMGTTNPTAIIHMKAGTAISGTGPLKFTDGINTTTPETGLMEFSSSILSFTPASTRKTFAFLESPVFTGTVEIPLLKFTKSGYGAYKALISNASGNVSYSRALGTAAYKDSTYFQTALTNPITGSDAGTTGKIPVYTGNYTLANSIISASADSVKVVGVLKSTGNIVSTGTATASSFIKTGGTSAQYLLADGSTTTTAGSVYKGELNGSTGVPVVGGSALVDGTGTSGWYYACGVGLGGSHNYGSGSITLTDAQQLYYNGSIWMRLPAALAYTLPIATSSNLGGVKSNDNVSVNSSTGGMTVLTNANLTGDVTSSGNVTTIANMSSATLAEKITDETGNGSLVFATSPTLITPVLGTPTSGNFSTGTFTWPTFNQNTTGTSAGLTAAYMDWNASSGGASIQNKPDLNIYRLNNDHDSLSTLQEKSYNSLTNKPDLTIYKQVSDSTRATSTAYVRQDRLTTELFKKVDKVSGKGLPDKNFTSADSILLVQYNLAKDSLRTKVNRNAAITAGTFTKIAVDTKGLVTSGSTATTYDITPTGNRGFITPADSIQLDNLTTNLSAKVTGNSAITGATKTKITYDSKGLVTFGADATTADIAEGTNLYYTDARVAANSAVVANTAKVTNATHTGDVTGATALTISNSAVTLGKMANLAANSLIGNNTGSSATPLALSASQVRSLLNVADGANNYTHPTGDGNLHVLATSTTNSGKVLTAGSTEGSLSWQTPTTGTVTSVSVTTANGVSGTVATSTTTPAISITLGAITPTSVAATNTISGTQLTSTIATGTAPLVVSSTTPVANLSIGGNAATVTTNANLTGPITSVGNATSITDKAVTLAKMNDVATGTVFYRKTTGTGVPEVQTLATLKTDLAIHDYTFKVESFSEIATGSSGQINTLAQTPSSATSILVNLNGMPLTASQYTYSSGAHTIQVAIPVYQYDAVTISYTY